MDQLTTPVVMLIKSGEGDDSQWFDFHMVGHGEPPTRIEWDKETMTAVLPANIAKFLIGRKYARETTAEEVRAIEREPEKKEEVAPPPKEEPVAPAKPKKEKGQTP
jgi:hypothetical protein